MLIALTCPQIETQTKKAKFVGRHVRYILLLLKEQWEVYKFWNCSSKPDPIAPCIHNFVVKHNNITQQ